ncbi:MAG: SDR family oxidoreductase [bacterium]|nr:SDR family oxidoreductase [bacterium]
MVTGGAGFIGSHLVDALIERNFSVHVVDNFSTGKRERLNPAAELHEVDIRDCRALEPIFRGADYVFHTAALARVQPSIREPLPAHDVNINGTFTVLLASRDAGVKRVVYSASSSAYGNQEQLPLSEDMAPRPMSPYALQKFVGEQYCRLFAELYGLPTVSLRYFNVYGPRQTTAADGPYATVVGIFLEQKRRGQPLTIVPDGEQRRDFTHVRDIVAANLFAMESDRVGRGEVLNIGTGRNYSVREAADLIGGPSVFAEPRVEPKETLADISLAKKLLGWEPEVRFEDGIAELKRLYGLT